MIIYPLKNPYKAYHKVFLGLLMLFLMSISLVSSAEFDNIKTYEEEIGKYGKITIRNSILGIPFLQLDKVIELELKENSNICVGFECFAEKEIILYEDGILINDIRFLYTEKDGTQSYNTLNYQLSIRTDEEITVDDFERQCVNGKFIEATSERIFDEENQTFIDINNEGYFERICNVVKVGSHQETIWDPYKLGEEIEAGTYYVRLDGELPSLFSVVDWQIKTNGYWLEEWLGWTSALNVNLEAYWNMTNISATTITDLTGHGYDIELQNNGNISEVDGRLNKAQWGDAWNNENYGNVSNQAMKNFSRNISFAAWINLTQQESQAPIISLGGTEGLDFGFNLGNLSILRRGFTIDVTDDRSINDSLFHHVAAIIENDGNIILYVDGTNNVNGTATAYNGTQHTTIGESIRAAGNSTFFGYIDELGVWNRSLTSAEVLQLYNNGVGIEFNVNASITLNTPINDSNLLTGNQLFNATVEVATGANITNATLYIWNSTNLDNFTTNLTVETVDLNNNTYIFTVNLPTDLDNYTWNVFGCSNESLPNPCNWAVQNRTFETARIIVNSQTFNNVTTEGATENFTINFTKAPNIQVSIVNLIYNETINSFPYSVVDDDIFSEGDIIIPAIDAEVNVSFFWNIILSDSTSENTTTNNQTIQNVSIGNCTTFSVLIYNFTLFDEGDQLQLEDNTTMEIEVNLFDLSKTLLLANYSQEYININPAGICAQDSLLTTVNYSSYVTVKYFANVTNVSYSIEYHNILNQTITNTTVPKNVSLFDLKEIDTTKFRLIFRDSAFNFAPNILVNVFRKYIVDNDFKVVEIPLTDSNGQTILNLVRNDIVYNLVMIDEAGKIVEVFNQLTAFCQDFTIGDCVINLAANSTSAAVFDYNEEFALSITQPIFNNVTNLTSINFVTDDLKPKLVRMDIFRNNQFGNRSVCSNSITSASATLTCDVNSIVDTDQFLFIYIYVDDSLSNQYTINLSGLAIKFGRLNGAFYAFLLILLIITLFMEDKKVLVVALGLGWVVALSLGLLSGLLIGATSAGIWLLIIIAIYLWKLSKEDSI